MRITHAQLTNGELVDVTIAGDTVRDVAASEGPPQPDDLDLTGHLLLTAPAEPHTHLDKALTADRIGADGSDLPAAVAMWSRLADRLDVVDVRDRALAALRELVQNGVTAVRTHVNVVTGCDPLVALDGVLAARDELAGALTLQVVVLAREDTSDELLDTALARGADLVGGGPHLGTDPVGFQSRLLAAARRNGVGVDLHTDETLDPAADLLERLAAELRIQPLSGTATASHCVSLGRMSAAARARAIAAVAAARIGVITLPATNLGLQGRDHADAPRGLTAVRELLAAGITVAAGGDNVRDPFNPVGRCDPFETASLLVHAAHLTVTQAWAAVTDGARAVMGLPEAGPRPGARADLVAVRATSLRDAVARAPGDRITIAGGRVLSRTTVTREVCVPALRTGA